LLDCISGIASKDQVNNAFIIEKTEAGKIIEIGEADQIQFERLVQLQPSVIFSYEIPGSATTGSTLISKLKISQLTVSEFLEPHPLGQLEWIKFVAAFFDKVKIAHDIALGYFS
jgi:iron complex transport system substrate-binding protein